MNFVQFLSVLRARWRVGLIVLCVTVAATLIVSLLLPKQYQATASVVIDVKPDPISAMAFGGMAAPAYMATQVDIIQSDRVAQRVVRNLKLTENPEVQARWQAETGGTGGTGAMVAWLADSFQKSLDVKPSRESNVVLVSYRAPSPRFASALANAFVQAYIETSLELRVDPARQYSSFFEVRAKEAREAVEAAQAKLSEFQNRNGITIADERMDVENARLAELSSQYVALQGLAADSNSRQTQALGSSADKMQEVFNSPVIAGLKTDISRLEGRLQELSARLGDSNPQVIELKANLTEMRTRMDAEIKRVTAGVGVSNNINRQRETQLRAELDAQRQKVLKMKAVRDDGAVLIRDVENAQRAYDAVNARLTQTSLESQSTQSNVNVLTSAVDPLQPASPKPFLNTVLSFFVGAMLAISTVLVMELMDRRVRGVDDVAASLGLPVIGVLTKPGAVRRKALPNLMKQRVLGTLPAPRS